MKFLRFSFILLAAMFVLAACSHTNKQLLRAEQLLESAPDSALSNIQQYNYNHLSNKDKALYGLLYIRIQDKKHLPLTPDSLLRFAIDYYTAHPDGDMLSTCYLYCGRAHKYMLEFDKATSCYVKALDNVSNNNNHLLLARLYLDMADIHYNQKDFALARTKYLKAYRLFSKIDFQPQAFYALLNIGRTYHYGHNYSMAHHIYGQLKPFVRDSFQEGSLLHEMGQNFYKANKPDSAYRYLSGAISYPAIGNNKAIRYNNLADLCFDMNRVDSAMYYTRKSLHEPTDIRTRKDCYRILVNCATRKGDVVTLNNAMALYQNCDDSIRRIDLQTKGSYIETLHQTQKQVLKSQSWIWYLTATILLLLVTGFSVYVYRHKKTRHTLQLTHQNHQQQKAEIRTDIMLKKRTALLASIERIKSERKLTDGGSTVFQNRIKSMYNELLHTQDTALFFCEMDGVLNNIVTKLKANMPDIREKELLWCCLHLLKVPQHDLLILLNYETINSLKRMKGRLALKAGLQNAAFLNDYLLQQLTID